MSGYPSTRLSGSGGVIFNRCKIGHARLKTSTVPFLTGAAVLW
jgi:hypothetical protein